MSETGEQTIQSEDIGRLKKLEWFTKENEKGKYRFDSELWQTISEIRKRVSQRGISTVLYPGALMDIPFPLSMTDADKFIFLDPGYTQPFALEKMVKTLKKIGHKVSVSQEDQEYKEISFIFDGRPRSIHLYPEDATKFIPEELRDHPSDILFLKNTYGGPTDIRSIHALAFLTSQVDKHGSIISYAWNSGDFDFAQNGFRETFSQESIGAYGAPRRIQLFEKGDATTLQ